MSTNTDRALQDIQRRTARESVDVRSGASVVAPNPQHSVARSLRQRVLAYTALAVGTALVGLRLLASALSQPLDAVSTSAAPTWMVEVTTASAWPSTALVYGRDVGIQLLQIPAGKGVTSDKRVVPARLARGELHLISLGLSSLRVRGSCPPGAACASYTANAPVITLYESRNATGVRTGW